MSYKPDESTLISYLYGELEEKDMIRIEAYFAQHPEEKEKALQLSKIRQVIGTLADKEVIAPPVFMDGSRDVRPLWQSSWFKVVSSLAASFLLLMVAGRLIGMEVRYSQGELRISFGGTKQEMPVPVTTRQAGMTSDEVQKMINYSLEKNSGLMKENWMSEQKKLDESIAEKLNLQSRKIDNVIAGASQASQEQVRSFIAGLQNDNLRLMKDYLQLSSIQQKKYVENLLVDFSKYLQEQRNQDLGLFQARMNNMEKNTDQFKEETEQILSSIISTASITKKKNSY